MRDRHQACGAVERRPEVVPITFVRLSAVDAHADDESERSPIGFTQSTLRVDGRCDRIGCASEHASMPSPVCFTTWPTCAAMADRTIASCRSSAARMAGSFFPAQRRVLPSMSEKTNVTVPTGAVARRHPGRAFPSRRNLDSRGLRYVPSIPQQLPLTPFAARRRRAALCPNCAHTQPIPAHLNLGA
jgi:hypothetical protein